MKTVTVEFPMIVKQTMGDPRKVTAAFNNDVYEMLVEDGHLLGHIKDEYHEIVDVKMISINNVFADYQVKVKVH